MSVTNPNEASVVDEQSDQEEQLRQKDKFFREIQNSKKRSDKEEWEQPEMKNQSSKDINNSRAKMYGGLKDFLQGTDFKSPNRVIQRDSSEQSEEEDKRHQNLQNNEKFRENRKFSKKYSKYQGLDLNHIDKKLLFTYDRQALSRQEWLDIISNKRDIQKISKDRLKASIFQGIPNDLRGEIWCQLCNFQRESQCYDVQLYPKLLQMVNEKDTNLIIKDLKRTLPELGIFKIDYQTGQNQLYNVLFAYSCYDNEVGYVQGMNYVAAMLIINIKDEVKCFWCLTYLLHRKNWRMIYNDATPKLINLLNLVRERLLKEDPELLRFLEREDLSMVAAFSPIFISLFISQVPLEIATRIFEYFMYEGEVALIRILFSMLKHKRQKIFSFREGELLRYMRTDIVVECIQELSVEQFFDY
eukprot:403356284